MSRTLLPTTVVGSYPQPDWLVDRQKLSKVVPRTRMTEIWRIPEPYLEQAQDDATVLAILDMERAGIDVVTDGENAEAVLKNAPAVQDQFFLVPKVVE